MTRHLTDGPYTCATCGAPMSGGYVVDGTLSCITCWLTGRGHDAAAHGRDLHRAGAQSSALSVRQENAARRAIAHKLKSRFFHAWRRPGYETLDAFLAGVHAHLGPSWFSRPALSGPDDPEAVLVPAHVVRHARNDIESLLVLVDDCLCYIAHLEEVRVPRYHPAPGEDEEV